MPVASRARGWPIEEPVQDIAVDADVAALVAVGGRVLSLLRPGHAPPPALALPLDDNHISLSRRCVVVVTRPAAVALSIPRRDHVVCSTRLRLPAGRSVIRARISRGTGPYEIRAVVCIDDRIITANTWAFGRPTLHLDWATGALSDLNGPGGVHQHGRIVVSPTNGHVNVLGVVDRVVREFTVDGTAIVSWQVAGRQGDPAWGSRPTTGVVFTGLCNRRCSRRRSARALRNR